MKFFCQGNMDNGGKNNNIRHFHSFDYKRDYHSFNEDLLGFVGVSYLQLYSVDYEDQSTIESIHGSHCRAYDILYSIMKHITIHNEINQLLKDGQV